MLIIPQFIYDQMVAVVREAYPLEGCGFLAGTGSRVERLYPIDNILRSAGRFLMAPQQQVAALLDIEEQGLRLLAIFHSHPQGPAQPSATDVTEITFPEAAQIIISLAAPDRPQVRAFQVDGSAVHEIRLQVKPWRPLRVLTNALSIIL